MLTLTDNVGYDPRVQCVAKGLTTPGTHVVPWNKMAFIDVGSSVLLQVSIFGSFIIWQGLRFTGRRSR